MALSSLTQLTYDQYSRLNITPFQIPPGKVPSGSPDSRVAIQLNGWVGTDVLAFTVVDQPAINANVGYSNANSNILGVTVNPGSSPSTETTYWTVNLGANASSSNWSITYSVSDGTRNTGTWVFTKGKSVEPFEGYV